MPENKEYHILVVDDESSLRNLLKDLFEDAGYSVESAKSGEEALEFLRDRAFHAVLTDIRMEGMSGMDLLRETRTIRPEAEVIIMTSHVSIETAVEALRLGAYDYLIKPFDNLDMVLALMRRALDKVMLVHQNRQLMEDLRTKNSELKELNKSIHELAIRDGLTSLYNHRYFHDILEGEFYRCGRHKRPLTLIMMDVDNFKNYNDKNGHLMGDDVLKEFGRILVGRARRSDHVARYGGEEFVALLPETSKELGLNVAEDFRRLIENHPFPNGKGQPLGKVTFSGGVSEFPTDAQDVRTLIEMADQAMYKAKEAGKNCIKSGGKRVNSKKNK